MLILPLQRSDHTNISSLTADLAGPSRWAESAEKKPPTMTKRRLSAGAQRWFDPTKLADDKPQTPCRKISVNLQTTATTAVTAVAQVAMVVQVDKQ
jgi:hypothetical protein